jgi:uncharacterized membrane protein YfcA
MKSPREIGLFLLEHQHYFVLSIIPVYLLILTSLVPGDIHYWLTYEWVFPIAVLIAVVVNMVGISGATLFVPFFSLILPLLSIYFSPTESVIIGLFTQSFGISSATLGFLRYRLVDFRVAAYSLIGVVPVVIISSSIAFSVPGKYLFVLISAALILSVFSLMFSRKVIGNIAKEHSDTMTIIAHVHSAHPQPAVLTDRTGKVYSYCRCGYRIRVAGHSIGAFLQGLTGFGVGEIGMVSMILSGIPMKVGIGTNHIVVASSAIIASFTYLFRAMGTETVQIPWNVIAITVPAVLIGGQFAPLIADGVRTDILEKLLIILLLGLAVALVYMGVIR